VTKPARFTQSDLTRVFKAAAAADVRARVEIDPNGRMVVTMLDGAAGDDAAPNPLDRVLRQ
jgi:hypothetical protein